MLLVRDYLKKLRLFAERDLITPVPEASLDMGVMKL